MRRGRCARAVGALLALAGSAAVARRRLRRGARARAAQELAHARVGEERFRRSFDDAAIGMALVAADGTLLEVNSSFCAMLGYRQDELVGRHFQAITHPDDVDVGAEEIRRAIAGELRTFTVEKRYVHAGGDPIWASLSASFIRPRNGAPYVIAQIEDVSERKRAEAQAHEAEQRARRRERQQAAVVELGKRALSGVGFQELCQQTAASVAETLETPFVRIMELAGDGTEVRQVAAVGWPQRIVEQFDVSTTQAAYTLLGRQPVIVEDAATETRFDARPLLAQGIVSGMSVAVADEDGSESYAVLGVHSRERRAFTVDDLAFAQSVANVLANAIHRQRAEDNLRHQALHDPLTGLPNRVLFRDRLDHALSHADRTGSLLAVLFLDVDEFKLINDSLGHEAGDTALRAVTSRLLATVREGDTLARFGGDEFVVLSEDLDEPEAAVRIADRMRAALAPPLTIEGGEHVVTASVGVAVAAGSYPGGAQALLRDADAAMYRAKAAGRDRTEVFDELMRARVVERLRLENGLRLALERGELRLVYQPLVSLDTGRSRRCEALLRWEHPERGTVLPGEFIPVAEASGLILRIGEWVLREACRQVAAWRANAAHPDLAELRVSVNVSARQLIEERFPATVASALADSGLTADGLVLEITETALIEDPDAAARTISALNDLGVHVALDDFGTGFSSLASLKRYPLAALKLDRSFVAGLEPGSRDHSIVKAVVEMARSLGLKTVGEGVETAAQLTQLRELGCEIAQGFLFSSALEPEQFEQLLREDFARPIVASTGAVHEPLRLIPAPIGTSGTPPAPPTPRSRRRA